LPRYPDTGGDEQTGAALVLDGSLEAMGTTFQDRFAFIEGVAPYENLGQAIVGLGDIDGDGFGEIALGDPISDSNRQPAKVGIFHGPLDGAFTILDADLLVEHETDSSEFGADLASLVLADGTTTLAVGATFDYYVDNERYGGVYVVDPTGEGTSSVTRSDNIALYTGEEHLADPGVLLHDLGDTDGDGVNDLGIGCLQCRDNYGVIYVVLGPHEGEKSLADADTRFLDGLVFARTGDTDGDGLEDLAMRCDGSIGELYLGPFDSGTVDTVKTHGHAHFDGGPNPMWTSDLAGADVDGDGFSDIAFPDPTDSNLYLFYGPVSGTRSFVSADLDLSGKLYGEFGWAIEAMGDIDDDGHHDLVARDWNMNLYLMLGEGI
jgi:hypothetical protein